MGISRACDRPCRRDRRTPCPRTRGVRSQGGQPPGHRARLDPVVLDPFAHRCFARCQSERSDLRGALQPVKDLAVVLESPDRHGDHQIASHYPLDGVLHDGLPPFRQVLEIVDAGPLADELRSSHLGIEQRPIGFLLEQRPRDRGLADAERTVQPDESDELTAHQRRGHRVVARPVGHGRTGGTPAARRRRACRPPGCRASPPCPGRTPGSR